MGFAPFLRQEKLFPANGSDLKTADGWRYDWHMNAREKCQNMRKWVQS